MKKTIFLFFLFIIFFVSSCTPKTTQESSDSINVEYPKIDTAQCVFEKLNPVKSRVQLADLNGKTDFAYDLILDEDSTIRVFWNQTSKTEFLLSVYQKDSDGKIIQDSRIILESSVGESSGCSDISLSKGDYQVTITTDKQLWSMIIEKVK